LVVALTVLFSVVAKGAAADRYLAVCALSTASSSVCPSWPPLTFSPAVSVKPKTLLKREPTPVVVRIQGKIRHALADQVPAFREATMDIDRALTLDATGIPVCPRRRLEVPGLGLIAARRVCANSIVGEGTAHVMIVSSELGSMRIPLTVYNGGTRDGETTLFVGSIVDTPTREPTVATVRIATKFRGRYGLHAVARLPVIADGQGSLVDFDLEIERILEAKCPNGALKISVPKLLFRNEAQVPGLGAQTVLKGGVVAPCTPKG
jgi:hypothetical protein